MDYKYDEESVLALVQWAENAELPATLQLSKCEEVADVKAFVRANVTDIKTLYPNIYCYGAINRLYRLKEALS